MTPMAAANSSEMPMGRRALAFAALQGFIAVAAGAFAAHGVTDPQVKDWLRTGAQYQLAHVVAAMAALGLFGRSLRGARLAAWLFLVGAALFSGSLYMMALTGARWLGAVTPVGGLSMLAGWASLAWAACRR